MVLQQYWTQPTPFTLRTDLEPGLEARVLDPLWLLLRQWQMSEFRGEDAGTPVLAEVERDLFALDRVELDGLIQSYAPHDAPLEAVVERETKEQVKPDLRSRAQAGRMLMAMLGHAGLTINEEAFRSLMAFPDGEFDDAAAADAKVQLLTSRAPDAVAMYAAFGVAPLNDQQLADLLPGANGPIGPYREAVDEWVARYEERVGQPGEGDAWIEDRLEYSFAVSATTDVGRVDLTVPEYHGGRLDWDAFRVTSVDGAESAAPDRQRVTTLATPVSYVGMPAARWWEFEDAGVDFGNTESGENDLGRLLLAEFAMVWGNDWFLVPVVAEQGGLCRLNELLVTDTFGVTTRIPPQSTHTPHWGLGRLSAEQGTIDTSRWLFIPPVLPAAHEATAVEVVRFVRDEMANMAWAIEDTVATPLGRSRGIADEDRFPRRGFAAPRTGETLHYHAMTDLPAHWMPMLPMHEGATSARMLVRAGLLDEMQAVAPDPAGELLGAVGEFSVHEEEIPRSGATVTRTHQLTRWYGGGRAHWLGRRKRAGAGEIRSSLEFDQLLGIDSG